MVGGICTLRPYGTDICHYAFIKHICFIFLLFLSVPFLYISLKGLDKLDGMVDNTSMPKPYVLF